ncbi:hypothetical protein F3J44_18270 [Pantoea sp. Tr-811]|uniref:hypothetical protein n=1 Tax=Pantoea sp. Tr-811 TaxID=2608361 RepID=UPI0014230D22|nr:hypothetical protein [Pantoea sp. Tr-811]NIF28317.1 hypothetical protein [Pantoea sp. Tr-811]
MDEILTPTSTLIQVMQELRKQNGDNPALSAIANVLGVETKNPMSLARTMIELEDTTEQAIKAVKLHVFGEQDMHLAPLLEIKAFFQDINLSAPWKSYLPRITPSMLQGLKFADHFITNSILLASGPKATEVADITSKLDSLLEECLKSEINPDLKQFFSSTINKLRSALNEYRIFGDSALDDILNEVAGSINRRSKEIKDQPEKSVSFFTGVFETIGRINDLVSGSENVTKAISASGIVYFLPHLG